MIYSKDDVINAALNRFRKAIIMREYMMLENPTLQPLDVNVNGLEKMFNEFYDKHGKDVFRLYANVTPDVMREYFSVTKGNKL
jgi:ATP phosphoribosyltransferase regulatory subunit HisZ